MCWEYIINLIILHTRFKRMNRILSRKWFFSFCNMANKISPTERCSRWIGIYLNVAWFINWDFWSVKPRHIESWLIEKWLYFLVTEVWPCCWNATTLNCYLEFKYLWIAFKRSWEILRCSVKKIVKSGSQLLESWTMNEWL